jgi:hypothetical protein
MSLLAGSAVICAVASSTSIILIVLINTDIQIPVSPLTLLFFVLAIGGALLAVLLMVGLYETSRHLDRFDDYKAELEQQWGPIDEKTAEA